MDDLLQEFIAETRETAEALAGEIVAWEAAPGDRGRLDGIFRFVHTVKGSCGFLDLPRLERLAHAAEDALAEVRDGKRVPDRALVDAVLAIVDRISEIVDAMDRGTPLDDGGEDLLIAALDGSAAPVLETPAAPASPVAARAPMRSVRLGVDLLDRMMSGMSDMVLARNELARRLRAGEVDPSAEAALERLSATVAEMRDTVTRTRMQKIDALFSALPRLVRDTAASVDKRVVLEIEGSDVELDREMIEVMRDPLVHIIRNSIDHGIEDAATRLAAGKPEIGRLTVAARQAGNQIVVEVTDDGHGIDTDRVIAKLVTAGRDERVLRALPERDKLELVFEPGLSTKDGVTAVSGRGVGMDVVRAAIDGIGGRIELDSTPGRGLRVAIHVPLTLSILSTIIVAVAGHRFAIPRGVIEEIVAAHAAGVELDTLGGQRVAMIRGRRLPMVSLAALLGVPAQGRHPSMLVIANVGPGALVIGVDDVLDHEELVTKPAAPPVMSAGIYAGQALPDSGRPMLLIDCAGVAHRAGVNFRREAAVAKVEEVGETPGIEVLTFRDLDGVLRALPLGAIDRIEPVAAHQLHRAGGRLRLLLDGALIPLAALGELPEGAFAALRLRDGSTEVAYAIAEASDIVRLPADLAAPAEPGAIAGVALMGDDPVELVDPLWLLAGHADVAAAERKPLALLDEGEGGWMATFLAPMLRGAGWRVAARLGEGETADVVIRLDAAGDLPAPAGAAIVRLVTDPAAARCGDAIHRYDRAGLLAAVGARLEQRR
ncbi:chemotaxis protein CheA [Sphingomonas spermidinifaciens]|uniref:Chemotaxis protein CheA n=1 Tax=Sphingomonas spermidinifaciens TaxID=1141889 RepID=A0A2A4B6I4_9SPHN|nr:chemotaxis protein CheW [Sphingomonas spermidinifaciens]PCD03690.1 chemotaxis protein CheA [Sphingomonas spermidinifaciens]